MTPTLFHQKILLPKVISPCGYLTYHFGICQNFCNVSIFGVIHYELLWCNTSFLRIPLEFLMPLLISPMVGKQMHGTTSNLVVHNLASPALHNSSFTVSILYATTRFSQRNFLVPLPLCFEFADLFLVILVPCSTSLKGFQQ